MMLWTAATTLPLFVVTNASQQFASRLAVPSSISPPLAFSLSEFHRHSVCKQGHHYLLPSSQSQHLHSVVRGHEKSTSTSLQLPRSFAGDGLLNGSRLTLFAADTNHDDVSEENSIGNKDDYERADDSGSVTQEEPFATAEINAENEENVPHPPQLLAFGYSVAAFTNVIAGLILLWTTGTVVAVPSAEATASMLATRGQVNLLATYTAGSLGYIFLAGGSCSVLSESAKTGRLYTSDTYKRLTMGTLIFGLLGMFSLPGEAGFIQTSSPTIIGGAFLMTQLAKFVTAFVSFVGWEYSAGGFGSEQRVKNILLEIVRGCRGIWRKLPVTDERPATFYRTFFILVTLGNLICNIPELVFNLQQSTGLFSLSVSLTLSSIARLGLLSTMLYILKDAAERKRLEGTTFIKLNMMAGLWAFGVGIAQGLSDVGPGMPFNIRKAADKFLFGLLFLNNGVLSQLLKMGLIKKRDEEDPDADPPLRI